MFQATTSRGRGQCPHIPQTHDFIPASSSEIITTGRKGDAFNVVFLQQGPAFLLAIAWQIKLPIRPCQKL